MDLSPVENVALLIAIVAAVRKYAPKVDGPWVLLAAGLGAAALSAAQYYPNWVLVAKFTLLFWIGAFGGSEALNRAIDRSNSVSSWLPKLNAAPAEPIPEQPTRAETPVSKKTGDVT